MEKIMISQKSEMYINHSSEKIFGGDFRGGGEFRDAKFFDL